MTRLSETRHTTLSPLPFSFGDAQNLSRLRYPVGRQEAPTTNSRSLTISALQNLSIVPFNRRTANSFTRTKVPEGHKCWLVMY